MPRPNRAAARATQRKEHEASHEKIVRQVARLVRERGVDAASVNEAMGAAGLTRGGFYAHFDDKTAMIQEALASAVRRGAPISSEGRITRRVPA